MTEIRIDADTLKALICGAVSEAMKPYAEELAEVRERTVALETINQRDKGLCPQDCPCQTKLDDHAVKIADAISSTKSAHHRIDGVFKTAAIVGGTVSGVVTILLITIQVIFQWHNSIPRLVGG